MKLNVSNWKEFTIGDFFVVTRGKRIVKNVDFVTEKIDDYIFPVVTASATNNSVDGYYNKVNCPGNSIVCGGDASGFFATYQEENCWVVDSSRIFIPKENFKNTIDKYVCFFLITIFRKEMFKFSYGRKCNPGHIMKTKIKLPAKNNEPDWEYMSKYIKDIFERERENNVSLQNILITKNSATNNIKFNNWKEFKLKDLFDVTGTKTTKPEQLENYGSGPFPYVTTQASNNGVNNYFNYFTEEGNVLTIDSATIGYCSYQGDNFTASDHVEKLIPKFEMNKYIALFLVTIINKNQFRFSYGRKCNQKQINNIIIQLPVDKQNKPDWLYMENYIKNLPYGDKI